MPWSIDQKVFVIVGSICQTFKDMFLDDASGEYQSVCGTHI